MQKVLAIYYIATSVYKENFPRFLESVPKFFPTFHKKVVVISDGLQEYDGRTGQGYEVQVFSDIEHKPWPYIALHKMDIIKDHPVECDYACYMNANLTHNPAFNQDLNHLFIYNQMNFSRHCYLLQESALDGQYFQRTFKNGKYGERYSGETKSIAYFEKDYQYCQSGFFLGPRTLFFKFCNDISELRKIDEANNIIPTWHDESYLNAWIYKFNHLNVTKTPIKRLMAITTAIRYGNLSEIPFLITAGSKKAH